MIRKLISKILLIGSQAFILSALLCMADQSASPNGERSIQWTWTGDDQTGPEFNLFQITNNKKVKLANFKAKIINCNWSPSSESAILQVIDMNADESLYLWNVRRPADLIDLHIEAIKKVLISRIQVGDKWIYGHRSGVISQKWLTPRLCEVDYLSEIGIGAIVAKLDVEITDANPLLTIRHSYAAKNPADLDRIIHKMQ